VNRYAFGSLGSLVAIVIACSGASGCSSDADESPKSVGDGVNDVKAACDIRATWTNRASDKCKGCLYTVTSAPCSCDARAGMCDPQSRKKVFESSCTSSIADCVSACALDCACVDACYAQSAACRTVASALDGCMAAACDDDCR
jgi:hypothetical protein